jgi:haloacid dehalogenase superfamily, subfamily IA, variant 1 with third motif having Dx(3-4)D or Dx(3-4)E
MVTGEYDFWLFDLDGTIIDAEWGYIRDIFDRVGQRLDRRFSDRDAEILWHGLGGPRNATLQRLGVDPEPFWAAFHAIETPTQRAEATYLHDDAAALLRTLTDRSTPVGLVTHCQEFLTEPVLQHLDIGDWFDVVIYCTDDLGWKPDPEPVRQAMAGLGVDTDHHGALVGDAAVDIGAAWNAGLDAVHVERHGHETRGRCVRGDYRVNTLEALMADTATDGGIDETTVGGVDGA